jgi:nucleoside-diphosphate-sugar epimerase
MASRYALAVDAAAHARPAVSIISKDDKPGDGAFHDVMRRVGRQPLVSVVIPARNEASNLAHVLVEIPDDVYEVILVDGHSSDHTVEVARALRPDIQVLHQTGVGKGNALMQGFARAVGDIVVMLDADGSTSPSEIPRFIEALCSGADFAKGSRFLPGGGSADITPLRRMGNRALSGLVNVLYGTRYTDLCYGYNAFWRYCVPLLQVECDGFEVETLINVRSARRGLRVVEVPSYESTRIHGASALRIVHDGMRVLRTIVSERIGRVPERDATVELSGKPAAIGHASLEATNKGGAVLVTGGCGFIGSRLSALLAADGRRVLAYDTFSRADLDFANAAGTGTVVLETGDVRDSRALRRMIERYEIDTVFHLAAMRNGPTCEKDLPECVSINVGGTQAVLDACEGTSVSAIVFASSAAVYAPAVDPVSEAAALAPVDVHGYTKLWGEQLLHLFHQRTGTSIGIARIFSVYGPGDTTPHLTSVICMQARDGDVLTVGNLSAQHDFVYVDDVAQGLMLLARSCKQRGWLVSNLGSGRAVDGASVVATLERLLGRSFHVRQDAARMHAHGDINLLSDPSLARTALGWKAITPLHIGLAEALRRPLANIQAEDLPLEAPVGA